MVSDIFQDLKIFITQKKVLFLASPQMTNFLILEFNASLLTKFFKNTTFLKSFLSLFYAIFTFLSDKKSQKTHF